MSNRRHRGADDEGYSTIKRSVSPGAHAAHYRLKLPYLSLPNQLATKRR